MANNLVVPVVAGVALFAGVAWTGADRVYNRALPEVGKRRALEQVKGYFLVPDDQSSNPEYRAWKKSRGV